MPRFRSGAGALSKTVFRPAPEAAARVFPVASAGQNALVGQAKPPSER